MTLPGTYERCMSGHYYAVVRGDEECSACKALAAAKLREAEQASALEIARTALHTATADLRDRLGDNDILVTSGYAVLAKTLTPSAALVERDRAIREDVLDKMAEMEVLLPIDHWGGTKKQLLLDFHLALIANARREFNLEPKPEGK